MAEHVPLRGVVDLHSYARILWRRRALVAMGLIGVIVAAIVQGRLATPIYSAQSKIAIEPVRQSGDASLSELILGSSYIESERQVVMSGPVVDAVIEELGLELGYAGLLRGVKVRQIGDTRVLQVVASNGDPELAAAVANSLVDQYLIYRRAEATSRLLEARAVIAGEAASLQAELADVDRRLASPETRDDEVDGLRAQRDSLLAQLGQLRVDQGFGVVQNELVRGGGTVLLRAEPATAPVSPNPSRDLPLAAVIGLLLGGVLALVRDRFDDVVHSEDQFRSATAGAAVLGRIPEWPESENPLVSLRLPGSLAAEAFRELRANVRSSVWTFGRNQPQGPGTDRRDGRSLLITSAVSGEGKSVTACNLAIVAALGGARVLIIDGDLRRPVIAKTFGIDDGMAGLGSFLAGDVNEPPIWRNIMAGLDVIPSGPTMKNPSELLVGRRMADLIWQLEQQYELIVIDAPPVLVVADALELASVTSASLIVASQDKSSQRAVAQTIERLRAVGARIAGTVLNRATLDSSDGRYAYYGTVAARGS